MDEPTFDRLCDETRDAAREHLEKIDRLVGVPKPAALGVLSALPTEVLYPETAPYLKTLRDRSASDKDRMKAREWLWLNGYDSISAVRAECDRVLDEIQLARLARADGLPSAMSMAERMGAERRSRWAAEEQRAHDECSKPKPGDPLPPSPVTLRTAGTVSHVLTAFTESSFPRTIKVVHQQDVATPVGTLSPEARSDGFSQSRIDEIKATMLALVAKRGGR